MVTLLVVGPSNHTTVSITLHEAINQFIAFKQSSEFRARYVNSLKWYLTGFAKGREGAIVNTFNGLIIEQFLSMRTKTRSSRRSWLMRLSSFFSFAKRRDWIAENPCAEVERMPIQLKPPIVLTPRQAGQILCITRRLFPSYLSYIVLGLLAGIRAAEIRELKWTDVDLERGIIQISADTSKVRRRRIVRLEAKAVAWLKQCIRFGPKVVYCSAADEWQSIVCRPFGLPMSRNILRHTAASYLLALHQDPGKVAFMLGNSPEVLLGHYFELVTPDDCRRFWKYSFSSGGVTNQKGGPPQS